MSLIGKPTIAASALDVKQRECGLSHAVTIYTVFMISSNRILTVLGLIVLVVYVSQKESVIVFQIVAYVGGLSNESIQSLCRTRILIHRYAYTTCFWFDSYRLMWNQGSIGYLFPEFDESNMEMLKVP